MESTRQITPSEKNKMRRKHLIFIPIILGLALVLYVVLSADSLPETFRWAGGAIAVLAFLFFGKKHYQLEQDLKKGEVIQLTGTVTQKRKMGGNHSRTSNGISSSTARRSQSSASYYLFISNRKMSVPSSIYAKVKEGDAVQLEYFEESHYYLGVKVIG